MSLYRSRNQPRASFIYDITEDGIICITDQDQGRTVTNDIHNVLADISQEENRPLSGMKVIYRDSSGCWDQVELTPAGEFRDFRSVNKYTLDDALDVVRGRE